MRLISQMLRPEAGLRIIVENVTTNNATRRYPECRGQEGVSNEYRMQSADGDSLFIG